MNRAELRNLALDKEMKHARRRDIAIATASVTFLVVLITWAFFSSNLLARSDTVGQPLRHGLGTVESVTFHAGGNGDNTVPIYHLRVGGQLAQFSALQNLQTGQQVSVDYRLGKSGQIYVEAAHP